MDAQSPQDEEEKGGINPTEYRIASDQLVGEEAIAQQGDDQ